MNQAVPKACSEILSKVESAINSVDAARLTPGQYADITRLKKDLEDACASGDKDRALHTEEMILAIIKEGPPMK